MSQQITYCLATTAIDLVVHCAAGARGPDQPTVFPGGADAGCEFFLPKFLLCEQAAREIANTIAHSANRVFLNADSLLLNLGELTTTTTGGK
jgi:hypothetical protein